MSGLGGRRRQAREQHEELLIGPAELLLTGEGKFGDGHECGGQGEVNLGPPPQKLRCSAGVGIQRGVVKAPEIHLAQLRYPSIKFRMPFVVPLLHEADQEWHQKSGRRRSVLTAEWNEPAVVPAADLGKLKGVCQ